MATESTLEARRIAAQQDDVARNVKRVTLAVAAIALLGGAVAMAVELRFGLFAAALLLGWTQLVGL